jgi:AhpD family alkylhydroperoxidase
VGHTAAGKLLGATDDAIWYEVAFLAGTVHGMNGVADGLRLPLDFTPDSTRVPLVPLVDPAAAEGRVKDLFAEVAEFFGMPGPPNLYRALANDPAYAADQFRYVRHVFTDGKLPRLHKGIIALAVSMTSRSPYGVDFHHREARRLGLTDAAMWELVFVTEQFNAVNKIGDCLHLEPDMNAGLRPPAQAGAPSGDMV